MLQSKDINKIAELKNGFTPRWLEPDFILSSLKCFSFSALCKCLSPLKQRGYSFESIFSCLICLPFLCSRTEFDLRLKDKYLVKYMGYSFDQKMRHLTEYINEHLAELKPIWDELKNEIGQLNRERRFLAHGFMTYYLPHETITTQIREKGKIVEKTLTLEDIESLTNRLHIVNTGENGINGEFYTQFTKARINQWNELVNDEAKIVYRVNSEIVSDWKGETNS